MNSVLVREMRQAVRNRTVIILLLSYLGFLTFGSVIFLIYKSAGATDAEDVKSYFQFLLYTSFIASALTVIVHSVMRLVSERLNEDMMFYSTIKPRQIAIGKFLSGFTLTVMFYSVTFPFITVLYLLRGVDIVVIVHAFVFTFFLVLMLQTLVLGFLAGTRTFLDLVPRGLVLLLCGGGLLFFAFFILSDFIIEGNRSDSLWDYIIIITILYGSYFFVVPFGMLFLATCQFAPLQANRMFATRILLTVLGLLAIIGCVIADIINYYYSIVSGPGFGYYGVCLFLGIYPVALFSIVAMSERCSYGLRLRKNIPRSFIGRLLVFPFYTGDCNAFVWLLL
ncbi:MAG: hypothetical protein ACRC2T_00915, partial [Thermoguttaceae bacterium]